MIQLSLHGKCNCPFRVEAQYFFALVNRIIDLD